MTPIVRDSTDPKAQSCDAPALQTGVFMRNGEYWSLGYAGQAVSLKDAKGLAHIQHLLRHPGEEFHALDLIRGSDVGVTSEAVNIAAGFSTGEGDLSVGGLGDAGEMLDPQAKLEYKRRLLELRAELADLLERGAEERAAEVEAEIDFLTQEISRAVGLGGQSRRAGSASERARLNVTRAVKAVLQRISEHHPRLGEVLARGIRTGSFCCYLPDARSRITWQFSPEGPTTPPPVDDEATVSALLRRETSLLRTLAGRTAFVGREVERAALRRLLEHSLRGQGKLLLIEGAAGVGKTRMASEAAAEALGSGVQTLVGACYNRGDSVPFIPFVEILEAALAGAPSPRAFREVLSNDAAEIARLLPQLGQDLSRHSTGIGDPAGAVEADPVQRRGGCSRTNEHARLPAVALEESALGGRRHAGAARPCRAGIARIAADDGWCLSRRCDSNATGRWRG